MASKVVEYVIKVRDLGSSVVRGFKAELESAKKIAGGFFNAVSIGAKAAAAGLTAAFAGVAVTIREAFKVETALTQFEVLLGSAEKAKKIFADLKRFSDVTPFEFNEVAQAGRMLLAFGEDAGSLIKTLTMLGDIASGVGMPFVELAEIYGKNRVQGRLMAQDVNQLTGRGIPVIGEFAKILGVAQDQVRDMVEQGRVDFAVLQQALQNLTSAGSQFGGMMDKMSTTGDGLFSTLVGEWKGALADFGKELMGLAKEGITGLIDGIKALRENGTITEWAQKTNAALTTVKETLQAIFSGDTKVISLSLDVLKEGVKDAFAVAVEYLLGKAPIIGELIGRAAKSVFDGTRGGVMSTVRDQMVSEGLLTKKGPFGVFGGLGPEAIRQGLSKEDVRRMLSERTDAAVKSMLAADGIDTSTVSGTSQALTALKDHLRQREWTAMLNGAGPTWKPGDKPAQTATGAAVLNRPLTLAELEARRAAALDRVNKLAVGDAEAVRDPERGATINSMRSEAAREVADLSRQIKVLTAPAKKPSTQADDKKKSADNDKTKPDDIGQPQTSGIVDQPQRGFDSMVSDMAGRWVHGARLSMTKRAREFRERLTGDATKGLGESFSGKLLETSFWSSRAQRRLGALGIEEDRGAKQEKLLESIDRTLKDKLGLRP